MIITNTKLYGLLVDDVDRDLNNLRWCWGTGNYAVAALYCNGARWSYRIHRIVLQRKLGRALRPGEVVDHINGNPLDNRRSNLRVATHQQNTWNRKSYKNSRSKYSGVWLSSRSGRWAAFVKREGIRYHIGYFDTEEEAGWMRDQFAMVLHGEFARLNFDYELSTGTARLSNKSIAYSR